MSSKLAEAFAGRRILVTGHTGFKGSWLVAWLKAMGANVSGLSLAPHDSTLNIFEKADIAAGIDSRIGDIRDADFVTDTVQDIQPEFIFHLAAQSLVRKSYTEPVATYATNVMGTVNLLESIRQCAIVKGVLVVTSDKCYENREWLWGYRESDAMGGHDPYSSSKGCAELVIAGYRRSFFFADGSALVASARAGNVIGGGDWAVDRLVPDMMRGAASGKPTSVRNPLATRPWQHVLDALGAYIKLAKHLMDGERAFAQAWNFGPTEHDVVSVGQVVERAKSQWDAITVEFPERMTDEPHEAGLLRLDSGKARSLLPWQPVFALNEAIDKTVSWYQQYYQQQATARQLMDSQIEEFRGRLQ